MLFSQQIPLIAPNNKSFCTSIGCIPCLIKNAPTVAPLPLWNDWYHCPVSTLFSQLWGTRVVIIIVCSNAMLHLLTIFSQANVITQLSNEWVYRILTTQYSSNDEYLILVLLKVLLVLSKISSIMSVYKKVILMIW